MKTHFLWTLGLLAMLSSCNNGKKEIIEIVPQPVSVQQQPGSFEAKQLTISAPEELLEEARLFTADFVNLTGILPQIMEGGNNANLFLILDEGLSQAGEETYQLEVSRTRIKVKAPTATGIFYGLQSLLQLPADTESGNIKIPCVSISDAPQFTWRGHMLDVSRHFFTVDEVKKQIDLLARYKLNIFH